MKIPPSGLFPIIAIYLTAQDRERLIRALVNWPKVPTSIVTFREPHEGQVQFILKGESEQTGGAEGLMVDKHIREQIEGKTDGQLPGPQAGD